MDKITFIEYQDKVLDIYVEIKKIFEKHNIKLWAHSGTLLGIMRHDNDFIPWDDDIDLMVSYKEYIGNKEDIQNEINSDQGNFYMIDFKNDSSIKNPNMNAIRIFSRLEYEVAFGESVSTARPFIDIFFAGPSNSFKTEFGWWCFSILNKSMWTNRKGFSRYHKSIDKKIKTFIFNLISYPMKFIMPRKIFDNYLEKKFIGKNKDWTKLRRLDAWSDRKIFYKVSSMINSKIRGKEILISEDWLIELRNSYGKNWKKQKESLPHIFSDKHLNNLRNKSAHEYLRNKLQDD